MKNYPRVKDVQALAGKRLIVTFNNGIRKIYDCSALLEDDNFKPLLNNGFFKSVKADKHGYGISWTDELDISESELWLNGVMVEQKKD